MPLFGQYSSSAASSEVVAGLFHAGRAEARVFPAMAPNSFHASSGEDDEEIYDFGLTDEFDVYGSRESTVWDGGSLYVFQRPKKPPVRPPDDISMPGGPSNPGTPVDPAPGDPSGGEGASIPPLEPPFGLCPPVTRRRWIGQVDPVNSVAFVYAIVTTTCTQKLVLAPVDWLGEGTPFFHCVDDECQSTTEYGFMVYDLFPV